MEEGEFLKFCRVSHYLSCDLSCSPGRSLWANGNDPVAGDWDVSGDSTIAGSVSWAGKN